jgi:transposase-like protein
VPVSHDREFWERACREVRRGAKVRDVARRLGVSPRTLQWWSWKLRQEPARTAEFLPIVASERPTLVSTAALELETNGVRIRVEIGADVRYVAELIVAIRAAC